MSWWEMVAQLPSGFRLLFHLLFLGRIPPFKTQLVKKVALFCSHGHWAFQWGFSKRGHVELDDEVILDKANTPHSDRGMCLDGARCDIDAQFGRRVSKGEGSG